MIEDRLGLYHCQYVVYYVKIGGEVSSNNLAF